MEHSSVKGSCLCGEVQYEFVDGVRTFQYCHCSRCRKFTGAAHAANIILDPASFRWLKGEGQVGHYEVPDATYHATAFCKKCGSSLPWTNKTGSAVIVPAGTLDDDPVVRPRQNIFYTDRASWYEHASSLPQYDQLPKR